MYLLYRPIQIGIESFCWHDLKLAFCACLTLDPFPLDEYHLCFQIYLEILTFTFFDLLHDTDPPRTHALIFVSRLASIHPLSSFALQLATFTEV